MWNEEAYAILHIAPYNKSLIFIYTKKQQNFSS